MEIYQYSSKIMELDGSPTFMNTFQNSNETIEVMNQILATQRRPHLHVGSMVGRIQAVGVYLFDIDMTKHQAELLGWKPEEERGRDDHNSNQSTVIDDGSRLTFRY